MSQPKQFISTLARQRLPPPPEEARVNDRYPQGKQRAKEGKPNVRRAAVACIIRRKSTSTSAISTATTSTGRNNDNDTLEVLLIKRATRRGDPWSGDVAFPGGHVETGETDVEAAVRETMEEIGLDLSDEAKFEYLTDLPKQRMNTQKGAMEVFPHIFLDITSDNTGGDTNNNKEHSFTLSVDEVEVVWWANFTDMMDRKHHSFMPYDIHERFLNRLKIQKPSMYYITCGVLKLIHVSAAKFPCIQVPSPKSPTPATASTTGDARDRPQLFLWGMTYFVILDLCKKGNEPMNWTTNSGANSIMFDNTAFQHLYRGSYAMYSSFFRNNRMLVSFLLASILYIAVLYVSIPMLVFRYHFLSHY